MSELHETLHATLAALATSDRGLHRFGARHHRYQPAPPLTPPQLSALERAAGVALPDDYRDHLLHVGDGGAGPYYGVLPFDHPVQQRMLAGSFDPREPWHGAVALAHAGCGGVAVLVVEGPARGQVWAITAGDAATRHVGPVDESFLGWYLGWVDRVAHGHPQPPLAAPQHCGTPAMLSRYLAHVEDRRGIARGQLPADVVREVMAELGDGSITIRSDGDSPLFERGDAVDPCIGCALLLEQVGVRPGAMAPGLPAIPARHRAAA